MCVPFCGTADTSQHHCAVGTVIEMKYSFSTPFEAGLSVNSLEANALPMNGMLDQIKHLDPVTEHNTAKGQPCVRSYNN